MPLEKALVRKIKRRLESKGAEVKKTHGSAISSGDPDIFACVPVRNGESMIGITVVIETKQEGSSKRPTPQQFARLSDWRRAGAIAFWTRDEGEVLSIIALESKNFLAGNGLTILRDFRPIPEIDAMIQSVLKGKVDEHFRERIPQDATSPDSTEG